MKLLKFRCRDMRRIESGYLQALIVFILSVIVNIPRWFEFAHEVNDQYSQ